jgi:hypothetical protein
VTLMEGQSSLILSVQNRPSPLELERRGYDVASARTVERRRQSAASCPHDP